MKNKGKSNGKRKLTSDQEFQIFKLVLDKFLWVGCVVMLYGVYQTAVVSNIRAGVTWMIWGVIVLLLLVWIIVQGYEVKRLKK